MVLAAIAVALWLTLSAMTGWTMMLMAIIVGGFVGAGVGIGNKGRGGQGAGFAAGTIAFIAALVGRFYAVQLAYMHEMRTEAAQVGTESGICSIANQIAQRRGEETVNVLEGSSEDFEEHTWQVAEAQWGSMSYEEQERLLNRVRAEVTGGAEGGFDFGAGLILSVLTLRGFDILCLGLAASTAFASGSRDLSSALATAKAQEATATPGKPTILQQEEPSAPSGMFATLGRVEKARREAEAQSGNKAA